jgi:hypothetical protein
MASMTDATAEEAVAQVRWPKEREALFAARDEGVPRLVLVDKRSRPPADPDLLEDWVRLPASDEDIRWRVQVLETRLRGMTEANPVLESTGLLRHGEKLALMTPIEHRLTRVLVDAYRRVVPRDHLYEAGWPGEEPNKNALDVQLVRLRRRLGDAGLRLRTVRSRGYVLDSIED